MQENKMGTMPIDKLIISMSLPIMISMLVQALYNIVDSIFVAQISENALTAVSMAFPIQNLMIAVGVGTAVGVNALLARSLGERDFDKVNKIAENAVFLVLLSYLLFLIIGLFFAEPFFRSQTDIEEIVLYGKQYLTVCCCLSFGCFTQLMFERMLQATGKTVYTMITQTTGAVINIILDPILIFGLFGFPKMGITGAAAATVIGQMISAFLVILYFAKFRNMYLDRSMLKPQLKLLKAIVSLGLAACINQIAIAAVQIVMNNILRYYGSVSVYGSDIPIACVGIVSKVNMVFLSICIGISQGCQPIWGFNYGARKFDRVRQTYRYSAATCTIIATAFFLCFQLFPHHIIGMFGGGSDLYFKFAENYLRIFMLLTFANGIQPMSSSFFTSIGKATLGIIMSLTRQVIFLLPLVIIFPMFMGIDGVMYAGPIADAAAFVLAVVFARRELGRMKKA